MTGIATVCWRKATVILYKTKPRAGFVVNIHVHLFQ